MVKIVSSNSIGNRWKSDIEPNDRRKHNIKDGKVKTTKRGSKKK